MSSDEVYANLIGRDDTEHDRLENQYAIITRALGWSVHPFAVSKIPSETANIADIATGTGAFLRGLADRYPKGRLDGYDISDTMFPKQNVVQNMTLSVADAKEPFPAHLHGQYDLVHARYLLTAMDPTDWALVLHHLIDLLKPGGVIQWVEPDIASRDMNRRGDTLPTSKTVALDRFANLWRWGPAEERIRHGSQGLPQLMKEAGVLDVQTDIVSTDRDPQLRRPLTENNLYGMARIVEKMAIKGQLGDVTVDELKKLQEDMRVEVESGSYVRYDIFTYIGVKPISW